jgi:gas vesicle protein
MSQTKSNQYTLEQLYQEMDKNNPNFTESIKSEIQRMIQDLKEKINSPRSLNEVKNQLKNSPNGRCYYAFIKNYAFL